MSSTTRGPKSQQGALSPTKDQLFLEDTVEVQHNGETLTGFITATWHDLEEEDLWDEIDAAICSPMATGADLQKLQQTGIPPRDFALFQPSSREFTPILVHESECTLKDRAFAFGDVIKKSYQSEASGTVVAIEAKTALRHSYFDPQHEDKCHSEILVEGVPEKEVELDAPWTEGDYVAHKSGWVGVVRAVDEDTAVKLCDDSVVVVRDPTMLSIPVCDAQPQAANLPTAQGARPDRTRTQPGQAQRPADGTLPAARPQQPQHDPDGPATYAPVGQYVSTTKANLRTGRWIYGAYNASIPPNGTVVESQVVRIQVDWIYHKDETAIRRRAVPRAPHSWIDLAEDGAEMTRLRKSVGGFKKLDGSPMETVLDTQSGGELQVGDRVRFRDLEGAIVKYDGKVKKIPRSELLGYDVNVFIVCETKTRARVQWQDGSETIEDATALFPYLNVDDHDIWPGEYVWKKTVHPTNTGAIFLPMETVGICESVDPAARIARVRWFKLPRMRGADMWSADDGGAGVHTLQAESEDVSLYELSAHPTLTLRRGDMTVIAPPGEAPWSGGAGVHPEDIDSDDEPMPSLVHPDEERVANEQAAAAGRAAPASEPNTTDEQLEDEKLRWVAEVVDIGLDGKVTLRYAGIDGFEEVRHFPERLHVIPADDHPDIMGGMDEMDEMDYMEGDSDIMTLDGYSDDNMFSDQEPEAIEEIITYEGDAPADPGQDDDWLTDDENNGANDSDVDMSEPPAFSGAPATTGNTEPVPRTPPPVPEDMPHPEAITLPETSSTPPRFEILDTPVPHNHQLRTRPHSANNADFTKRIMREYKILASSLPEGIFVRTWESRLDLFRVMILGPLNTPYEHAPFLFDFYFPSTFPALPPTGYFHSWTNGVGRVNPNLYDDGTGKICLSLLGTWHAEHGEGWATSSTILQLLVSLLGLVLVREPWYNEAGFSIYEGTEESQINSQLYSEKAYILSRRFVRHVLEHPVPSFENVVKWLYTDRSAEGEERPELLRKVVEKGWEVVKRSESGEEVRVDKTEEGVGRLSRGAMLMLKKDLEWLGGRWETLGV